MILIKISSLIFNGAISDGFFYLVCMWYYYVRFNVYPPDQPPQEKEVWLKLESHHDDKEMKLVLQASHQSQVSIIQSNRITEEEYETGSGK